MDIIEDKIIQIIKDDAGAIYGLSQEGKLYLHIAFGEKKWRLLAKSPKYIISGKEIIIQVET